MKLKIFVAIMMLILTKAATATSIIYCREDIQAADIGTVVSVSSEQNNELHALISEDQFAGDVKVGEFQVSALHGEDFSLYASNDNSDMGFVLKISNLPKAGTVKSYNASLIAKIGDKVYDKKMICWLN